MTKEKMKFKVFEVYWDREKGEAVIKWFNKPFGVEAADCYNDVIHELGEENPFEDYKKFVKNKKND